MIFYYIGESVRSFIRNNTGSQRSRSYRQVPNSTPKVLSFNSCFAASFVFAITQFARFNLIGTRVF